MSCQKLNFVFSGAVLAALFGFFSVYCTPLPDLVGKPVNVTKNDAYVSNDTGTLAALVPLCGKCKTQKHGGVLDSLTGSAGFALNPVELGFKEAEDLLRFAALVPAETLQLLRMVTVPLINTSLGVPANLLEQLSNSSMMSLIDPTGWQLPRGLHLHSHNATGNWFNMSNFVGLKSHTSSFNLTQHSSHAQHLGNVPILSQAGQGLMSPFGLLDGSSNTTRTFLPPALNADHLMRHFDSLTKFIGARQNATSAQPVGKPDPPKQ